MLDRIGRTGRAGMKGESFTFLTSSGEDVWKAMGIVEVMQKTNQPVSPQVQVKPLFQDVWKKDVIQKTNLPIPPQVQVKPLFQVVWKKDVIQKTNLPVPPQVQLKCSARTSGKWMSSRRPTCLSLLKTR